jgi:hypothetical protein
MLKKRLSGMTAILVGIMLVFAMIECGGSGNPPAGPGAGGDPVLNTREIWKDDNSPTVGMLFISGDVYYYYLTNATWGNREKIGTWDGGNTIAAVFSVDPDTTFTVSGTKLYEYRETTNTLVATYTKTTGQTIQPN